MNLTHLLVFFLRAFDPTRPPEGGALVSAEIRTNWEALEPLFAQVADLEARVADLEAARLGSEDHGEHS